MRQTEGDWASINNLLSHDWYYEADLLSVAQEGHGDQEINWSLKNERQAHFILVFGFSDKQPALYS